MRKLLSSIAILLTLAGNAQVEKYFKTTDRSTVSEVVNEVLSLTTVKYNQVQIDSVKCRQCIQFWYSDGDNFLYIDFYKTKEGGNKDLGTPDTVVYRFVAIRGIFKDVFPFWKKHFQNDADFEKTAIDKHGKVIQFPSGYYASINGSNGFWMIEIKKR